MYILILGYICAILLNLSLLPQLYQTYKTKNVESLSQSFLIFQVLICVLLITYTSLKKELPLLVANTLLLFQFIILNIMKHLYKNNKKINDIYTQTSPKYYINKQSFI